MVFSDINIHRPPHNAMDDFRPRQSTTMGGNGVAYSARGYELKRLKLIAAETGPGHILDIGHAQLPNPYLDNTRCTGFDLDQSTRCDYAEQKRGDIGDIAAILVNRQFDTVIAAEFIEHVEDPYSVLRSLHGLIAPDGRLILSTPSPVGFPTLFFEWSNSRRFFYTAEHTYYFSPRWMIRVLESTGYRVHRLRAVGLWPVGFIPIPVALSYQVIYVATPSEATARPTA